MDERYDLVRSVRDERYVYVRNYMPHLAPGQHVSYMFETPTTRAWKRLYDAGKLTPPQSAFWQRKPPEELYDLENDRDEVRNLAGSPGHQEILARLRAAHQAWEFKIRDVDFLPEDEIHSRSKGSTPYEVGHDEGRSPLKQILLTADLASSLQPGGVPELSQRLADADSAVRYWAALGILMRGAAAVEPSRDALRAALVDRSPSVRVVAAQALGQFGNEADLKAALPVLIDAATVDRHGLYVAVLALNALDALDEKAASVAAEIKALPRVNPSGDQRTGDYLQRLIEKTLADLEARPAAGKGGG
jgi:uncharacterized sulfatase